ncbi:MAG TPA: hypothetical protein VGM51_04110 [Armatimonadota bacterium]
MPNELSEIEVDEVSLVDRPATGRRFVIFKRGGLLRRASPATTENICSREGGRMEELEKRTSDAEQALAAVRDAATELERRLAAVEAGFAPRQSQDTPSAARGLWAGVI